MDEIDVTEQIKNSPVLKRLQEEVRLENELGSPNVYNRMHNRHNRSFPRPRPFPLPPIDTDRKI